MKRFDNIEEDKLRELLKENQNPFNVPDGYFENLSEAIQKQVQPMPDYIKQAEVNPFSVPEGYFEKLPLAISDKVTALKKSHLPEWISNALRPRLTIPLTLVAVFIIAFLFYFKLKNNNLAPQQEISSDDISNSGYLQMIDEDMLLDAMLSQNTTVSKDDSLEQYLIDNNIDISQIEKEL